MIENISNVKNITIITDNKDGKIYIIELIVKFKVGFFFIIPKHLNILKNLKIVK